MTKTGSYANHCVQTDENVPNEATQSSIINYQFSPVYWAREGSSRDLIERPPLYGNETQTCIESGRTYVDSSKVLWSQFHQPNSGSILEEGMKMPIFSKLQSQLTMQRLQSKYSTNEATKYAQAVAFKSKEMTQPTAASEISTRNHNISSMDSKKVIHSPKDRMVSTMRGALSTALNFDNYSPSKVNNSDESSAVIMSVGQSLMAVQEPIVFPAKNDETLQANRKLTTATAPLTLNESIPLQSHNLNGFTVTSEHNYYKPTQRDAVDSASPQDPASQVIQPNRTSPLPLMSTIYTETNVVKPTTSAAISPGESSQKTFGRSNKIIVQSNELIAMPTIPPVVSKSVKIVAPIQMASSQPKRLAAKPRTSKAVKKAATVQMTSQSHLMRGTQNKENSKLTPATVTSVKRKNEENIHVIIVPPKVIKVEKPVAMKTIVPSSVPLGLPEISIQRGGMVKGVQQSAAVAGNSATPCGHCSDHRSISECLSLLKRNGVEVFKVPRKPSNEALKKYMKILELNNVSVLPVSSKR